MGKPGRPIHQKSKILVKLVEDLGEFTSDTAMADISSRVLGEKVNPSTIRSIRDDLLTTKVYGSEKRQSELNRYDPSKIREFLDEWRKRR